MSEAAKIDLIAPAAKEHTDAQRLAVLSAPASAVKQILTEKDATISVLLKTVSEKDKTIADLKDAELKTQAKTLRLIGLGLVAVAGLLLYARQIGLAAASALAGIISLGLAQLISQPWFMPAVGGLTVLALVGFGIAAWQSYKKHTLEADAVATTQKLKETLGVLVPAIDSAYDDAEASVKEVLDKTVFSSLSRLMDASHKAVVKQVRASN